MGTLLPLLCVLVGNAPASVETRFAQVAPAAREVAAFARTPGKRRAAILIHGLRIHPISKFGIVRAAFSDWQQGGSALVKLLAQDCDVFAFAYTQTAPADEVAEAPDLSDSVRRVRLLGYAELVLVGYSAGGVIAREFVEDNPDAGVTKVVQVCAPNGGSGWASLPSLVKQQSQFLHSLTKQTRSRVLGARADRQLPPQVEFVCLVGTGTKVGDGLVSKKSQWTDELQSQGVPAVAINDTHWHVLHGKKGVELIASLVREPQSRWDAARVAAVRREILGTP
jgi:pimeloyl-ACP methyl ester carboxylesterase